MQKIEYRYKSIVGFLLLLILFGCLKKSSSPSNIVSWGDNRDGQCDVPAGLHAKAIAAGSVYSLALREDGTVAAWGDNYDGQSDVPINLNNVISLAVGAGHSMALKRTP